MFSLKGQSTNIEQIRNQVQKKLNDWLKPLNELPDSAYVAGSWTVCVQFSFASALASSLKHWFLVEQWWSTPWIQVLRRQGQLDLCEFEASLIYRGQSRLDEETLSRRKRKDYKALILNHGVEWFCWPGEIWPCAWSVPGNVTRSVLWGLKERIQESC